MKQICVIGLGQFGTHLARTLAQAGCEVLAIDADDKAIAEIRDEVHHAVITDVRSLEALQSVVTPDVDEVIVSLGEDLEPSILCTLHLKQIGVKRIRAKASGRDHAAILKAVGASDVIFPERETAERMAQRIVNPDLLDYLPLSPEYHVVELEVPEPFVGQSLAQLQLRKRYHVLAIAIKETPRGPTAFLPSAESVLNRGNTLVLIGKSDDIARLSKED